MDFIAPLSHYVHSGTRRVTYGSSVSDRRCKFDAEGFPSASPVQSSQSWKGPSWDFLSGYHGFVSYLLARVKSSFLYSTIYDVYVFLTLTMSFFSP